VPKQNAERLVQPASGLLDVIITLTAIAALEMLRALNLGIPNPGMLLALTVLSAGYRGGISTGMAAAGVSLLYLFYFHSGGDFVPAGEQWVRLSVLGMGLPGIAYLAGRTGAHARRSRMLIAQLTNAERELVSSQRAREAEARLKMQVLDGLPAAVALLDAQGTIISVNGRWQRLIEERGIEGERFAVGQNYGAAMSLCPLLGLACIPSPLEEVQRGARQTFSGECGCPSLFSGFRIEICGVDLPQGRGAVVMHIDETERCRVQEELQQSRAVLEQAQSVAHVGSWVWEIQTGELSWSPETMRIFGVNPEEFDGRDIAFDQRVHPEDREAVSCAARSAIAQRRPYAHDHRIIRSDGQVRWLHERAETIYDAAGNAIRMVGVVQDITERKEAADALAESEERYRLLFELNPQPMMVYARGASQFLAVNNAAVRHYGFSREEFLAMSAEDLLPPEQRGLAKDALPATGRRHEVHYHVKKDGSIIEVEVSTDSMIFQGRDAIVAVASDVTERRRSERLLGGQNLVLGLLATGARLEEVLETLAQSLDRQIPGVRASILLADESGTSLRLGASPGLPSRFLEDLLPLPIGPGCASCGTAVHLRDRVIVEDIATDPLWEQAGPIALRHGLAACWSQPILTGDGAAIGSLALYCTTARAPHKRDIKLLESAAYLAGIAIERTRAQQALTSRERMLRLQMEQMPSACIVQDQDGAIIQWNPGAERIFGWTAEEAIGRDAVELLVPAASRAEVRGVLADLPALGRTANRNENLTRDGRTIVCEWQNAAVHDESGRVVGLIFMAQDVTERLAAEEALRRSEQLNRRIIEHMPGGLVQVGMDGRIVKANSMAVEHLGCTYDELTAALVADFGAVTVDEDGREYLPEDYPVVRCLKSGAPEGPVTIGVRRPDGKINWGLYTAIPLHRPDGEQDGALVTFLDLTHRKEAEAALRDSEERFRFAQACASAGTFDWDPSDRLLWSESTYQLFGIPVGAEMSGNTWLSLIVEADRQRIADQMAAVAAARDSEFRMEYRICHPQDGIRSIATLGRCMFDQDGHAVRVAGIHIDLTELKTAQAALARSEERYRRLADHGAMGIWEVARESGETVFANPAMCRMLEVDSPEELQGTDFRTFFTPESRRVMEIEHAKRVRGEVSTYEVELVGRRGGRRFVMITGTPATNAEEGLDTLIGTFTDISDRKMAEDALRQAQKLDAVGRLASGIAHDFNNLLTAIFGFTSLARRTLSANHPATKALDRVDDAAQQASGVTRGLLTFTRQNESEKRPVRLGDVVQDSVRLLRRTLPAGIELRVRIAEAPVWVRADTTQLHQVLMNLAINARDAMPAGGHITISVDRGEATLSGSGAGQVARFSVSDTGTGMPPDVRSRIFEPFFTTKPAGEGTGLGLPIIHGIVNDHGGRIEVDSEPGKGTTFRILLPLTELRLVDDGGTGERAMPAGRGELVLLADDHGYVREIVASMLLSMGYRVLQASDGPGLLEQFQASQASVRLLIVDSQMPGWSSQEGITRMREAGARIPAILLSGTPTENADSTDPDTLILRKPFQMTELADAVAKALHAPALSSSTPTPTP
jgi:two-component system, cell cycle sensor histidine kinase and response regulator CckA